VASEQFHTNGGIDQVDFERRGGDRYGFVVAEHFWAVSLAVADARWDLNSPELTASKMTAAQALGVTCFDRLERRRVQCSE
jgi:hypothetical protein